MHILLKVNTPVKPITKFIQIKEYIYETWSTLLNTFFILNILFLCFQSVIRFMFLPLIFTILNRIRKYIAKNVGKIIQNQTYFNSFKKLLPSSLF